MFQQSFFLRGISILHWQYLEGANQLDTEEENLHKCVASFLCESLHHFFSQSSTQLTIYLFLVYGYIKNVKIKFYDTEVMGIREWAHNSKVLHVLLVLASEMS